MMRTDIGITYNIRYRQKSVRISQIRSDRYGPCMSKSTDAYHGD